MRLIFSFIALISLFSSTALEAQTEVHAVGVYQGREKTEDRIHGPRAEILVDRPDATVILAIGSYSPLRWYIETTPGTRIETVYIYGREPGRSEIYLNDVPLAATVLDDLRATYEARGSAFRKLVERLTDETGTEAIASFQGAYGAPVTPFVIDRVDSSIDNRPDRLAGLVRPDAVPAALRPYLTNPAPDGVSVEFNSEGFVLTEGAARRIIPASLDVPRISWPVGAAYDRRRGILYGVSLGGEGYLYQYDLPSDRWSVTTSMNQLDASGMIFDPGQNRLIMGSSLGMMGFIIHHPSKGFSLVKIAPGDVPGLTDLPSHVLTPVAIHGDLLLAEATGARAPGDPRATTAWRTYLIDMGTGAATLVAYKPLPER